MNPIVVLGRVLWFSSGRFALDAQRDDCGTIVAVLHHEEGRMFVLREEGEGLAWSTPEGLEGRGSDADAVACVERWMNSVEWEHTTSPRYDIGEIACSMAASIVASDASARAWGEVS